LVEGESGKPSASRLGILPMIFLRPGSPWQVIVRAAAALYEDRIL